MSSRKPAILFIAAAATSLAMGVEPIYTDPVGFVKLGNPVGVEVSDAVPADTDILLSVPLETALEYTGVVTGWSKSNGTISVSGSPWTTDSLASGSPRSAIISSGAENGLRGLIVANSADTVTISLTTPGDLDGLTLGDTLEIRKCWTMKTFFENSDIYDFCEIHFFNEAQVGTNHSSARIYTYYDGTWYFDLSEAANDHIIHPGEMFILRTGAQSIPRLTVFGDVPKSQHRISLMKDGPGQEDLEIGLLSPIPQKIGAVNLPAEDFDEILIYNNISSGQNKASAQILTYYEGIWYLDLSEPVSDSFDIRPGQGFKLRRNATSLPNVELEWRH